MREICTSGSPRGERVAPSGVAYSPTLLSLWRLDWRASMSHLSIYFNVILVKKIIQATGRAHPWASPGP
jgi:hypothetical protein